jgi:hypothetical protein
MLQTNLYRKLKQPFHIQYFFPQIVPVYEIMWKNMVQPDRPQMAIHHEHALSMLDT